MVGAKKCLKSNMVSNRMLSIIPGDSMIIGNLVWQDLQSESGVQCANSGFATFFRGTSKYFVVGLFDTGLFANELENLVFVIHMSFSFD